MKIEIPEFKEFSDSNISGRMIVNPYWLEHLLNLFFQGYLGEIWEEIMDTEKNKSDLVMEELQDGEVLQDSTRYMKNKTADSSIKMLPLTEVKGNSNKEVRLYLTDKEICSLFDILLMIGHERKMLRLNGLDKDYSSIIRKIEIVDTRIHRKDRTEEQLKNWVNRNKQEEIKKN